MLDEQIAEGDKLLAAGNLYWVQWEEWRDRWKRNATDALRSIYANDSAAAEFREVADLLLMSLSASHEQERAYNRETVGKAVNVLRSLKDRLRYLAEPSPVASEAPALALSLSIESLRSVDGYRPFLARCHAVTRTETLC